jgi:hypothetical protein
MRLLLVVLVAGLLGGGAETLSRFFHEVGNTARQAKASLTGEDQQVVAAAGCRRSDSAVTVSLPQSKVPLVTRHIRRAWEQGLPRTLNLRRDLAASNSQRITAGIYLHYGLDADLWPIAASRQARGRVSVVQIPAKENRQAGRIISHQLQNWCNGQRFRVKISD